MTDPHGTSLTEFQIEVAQRFFATPEAAQYVLAGAGGLAAQGLIVRPTQDLDLFTTGLSATVTPALEELQRIGSRLGWLVDVERNEPTFCRLTITRTSDRARVDVDLAVDVAPRRATTMTFAGPAYAPAEAAARKLLALFDRAAPRDFADVYALARQGFLPAMIEDGPSIDLGFDLRQLAIALAQLPHIADQDLDMPAEQIAAMRTFYNQWHGYAATGSSRTPTIVQDPPAPPTMMWRGSTAPYLPPPATPPGPSL